MRVVFALGLLAAGALLAALVWYVGVPAASYLLTGEWRP